MTTPRFQISRSFAAPRQRVWDAWTDPVQLAAWFGPKGTTGSILAFDLRPGGEWRGRASRMPTRSTRGRFLLSQHLLARSRDGFRFARNN